MKNKGYTLLELLGVIVILSVLVTLVFPSVINFIKKGNDTKESITNELIISAAEDYINDNSSELYLTSGNDYCVTVNTLVEMQYLNSTLELDNYIKESKSVKVTYDNGYKYEIVDSDSCFICKLVSDLDENNELSIGDKYQCKVKNDMEDGFEDGYYFYVLSYNDGTGSITFEKEKAARVNLIMERNMYYNDTNKVGLVATTTNKGYVAWYGLAEDTAYGPVTVMNYLHNTTKDWDNVPNVLITYNEFGNAFGDNGYGILKTIEDDIIISKKDETITATYNNLKARLPMKLELTNNGCSTIKGNCASWLVTYLNPSSYVSTNAEMNIDGIYGYWSISSTEDIIKDSWSVRYNANINYSLVTERNYLGVRPVITISNGVILDQ